MQRDVLLIQHLCLFSQKIPARKNFQQDIGSSSNIDQKQGGVLLSMKDLREEVAELMMITQRADTQFSESSVSCLEERSKARQVENYL